MTLYSTNRNNIKTLFRMKNSKRVLIIEVPPKHGYFVHDLCLASAEKAEKWIYDGYAKDAEKIVDPEPYFNPESLRKVKDGDLEAFAKEKKKEYSSLNERLRDLTKEITEDEKNLTNLQKKKAATGSAYDRMNLTKRIDQIVERISKAEKEVFEIAPKIKSVKIECINAEIKIIDLRFQSFVDNGIHQKARKKAEELLDINSKLEKTFERAISEFNRPFLPIQPYMTGHAKSIVEKTFVESEDVLKDVQKRLTSHLQSQLNTMYKEAVLSSLQDD